MIPVMVAVGVEFLPVVDCSSFQVECCGVRSQAEQLAGACCAVGDTGLERKLSLHSEGAEELDPLGQPLSRDVWQGLWRDARTEGLFFDVDDLAGRTCGDGSGYPTVSEAKLDGIYTGNSSVEVVVEPIPIQVGGFGDSAIPVARPLPDDLCRRAVRVERQ